MELRKLFEPCYLGKLKLDNRIVMPPMTSNYVKNGFVTDRMISFYAERARGGVGLIIVEDSIIESPRGRHSIDDILIDDDRYIPDLNRLARSIKDLGAKAGIQLSHSGRLGGKLRNGKLFLTNGQLPVAPSAIAYPATAFVVPKELDIQDIEKIGDKFASAAWRAKEAGFEILGLHCTHGYLIEQFLSPLSNKRNDEYGGDFNKRFRFLSEIIHKIKKKIGDDFPLMCRISGEELSKGGLTIEDARRNARELEKVGVDCISVSIGASIMGFKPTYFVPLNGAPMRSPRGELVHLASAVKDVVSIPVMTVNRITTPQLAEQILEQGKADLIGIGRGLIADPEWPKKAGEGRLNEIRHCISCQYCFRVVTGTPLVCAINPVAGREQEFTMAPALKAKIVFIAGGGPAGMEAARIATLRGHKVCLYEKHRLGGQLNMACLPPGKGELRLLLDFGVKELNRLGVKVENKELDIEIVKRERPDVVILATGAKPAKPEFPCNDNKNVISAWQALNEKIPKGKVVVIGGRQIGAETAEYLAKKGNDVVIVEESNEISRDTQHLVWFHDFLKLGLELSGVKIFTRTKVEKVNGSGVKVERDGQYFNIEADTVVLALGNEPNRELLLQLENLDIDTYLIGDCAGVGKIVKAVRDGFSIGFKI